MSFSLQNFADGMICCFARYCFSCSYSVDTPRLAQFFGPC